jgi:antitoxin VapB
MATLTKIIRNGNSQAIRIPAALRLKAREVEIYPTGGGLLIVDPEMREERLAALEGLIEKRPRRNRALAPA